MKKFNTLVENLIPTSKFDMSWQLIRTQARQIKDVQSKINFVLEFLEKNPNIHNYLRVKNWLNMTKIGYKDFTSQQKFDEALNYLEEEKAKFQSTEDNNKKLSDFSTNELNIVYKDLNKRKYNFQFNKTPVAHIEFIKALEDELSKRK